MALTFTTVQNLNNLIAVGSNLVTSTTTVTASDTVFNFGGTSNLGGASWTPADISSSNFGAIFRFSSSSATSSYLRATNFGFSIPSGETILGIQYSISAKGSGIGTPSAILSVNYITCTITTSAATYTSSPKFFIFLGV